MIIRQRASFLDPLLLELLLPLMGRPRGIMRHIVRWWNCEVPAEQVQTTPTIAVGARKAPKPVR